MRARTAISSWREGAAVRLLWRLDSRDGLIVLFAAGLLLQLALAPKLGFYGDLQLFRRWTARLAEVGTHAFYVEGQFADYPPGYLYVLWLTGKVSATPAFLLLKLPPILANLGIAWVAAELACRLAPRTLHERLPVRPVVAAAVLLNPAVLFVGPVWGQVDSVPAFLVLTCLLLLFTGKPDPRTEIPALLLYAVAIAMKPQSGFMLPVMLYALYRHHVHGKQFQERIDGLIGVAVASVLSLGLWAVSGMPFGLGPVSLVRFYGESANVYPVTSANAFNLWGAVGFWRPDSKGADAVALAGISAARIGMLLFLAITALVLWRTHRAIERGMGEALALTAASAVVALAAYVVLTRMHERYMFMALALLAPLVLVRQLRWAYAGLSALFCLDLWYVYAYFNTQWKSAGYDIGDFYWRPVYTWVFGEMLKNDTWQKTVWSLLVTGIALAVAWRGRAWAASAWPAGTTRTQPLGAAVPPPMARTAPETAPARPTARRRPPDAAVLHHGRRLARAAAASPPLPATRFGPHLLVALACAFCLFVLKGELLPAPNLNDSAFHLQMVRWAYGQIGEGRIPLDGWYPYLSLGSSFFHHYQSLPHTLTALIAHLGQIGPQTVYLWIQYLLLALWPVAVFLGTRLLGWGRWTAAAAAAVAPLLVSATSYGYEHSSYSWQGFGVYSQLWAMWLLPLAWGLTWRSVTRGTTYAAAALALALTMATHFITGYLAVLTLGVWVLAAGPGYLRRAGRAALVAVGSMLIAAWVLVPLIGDTKWTTQSVYYRGSIFNDSYGAAKVLGWLFHGQLFDDGRLPVVTILVALGIVVCASAARADHRARALLGAFTLGLLLFFGRPTLGPILDILPGFGDIQIHRFLIGVQLSGILLAGIGLSWLARQALALLAGARPSLVLARPPFWSLLAGGVVILLTILVLAPAWRDIGRYDLRGAAPIRAQRVVDRTDGADIDQLIEIVRSRGDGRVYSGLRGNWGRDYRIAYVPVHVWYTDRMMDAIGFTFRTIPSLSTDVEVAFDEANPAQYEMFNIRYLILPSDRQPGVPAKLLATGGQHKLWSVGTTGYLQVVDRAAAVRADRTNLESATAPFRQSNLASRSIYPSVAFPGVNPVPPQFEGSEPPSGPPGSVIRQSAALPDGAFEGTVRLRRPAMVLLKASYDPRWTATVDGRRVKPIMMAPSLVGVDVPAGRHEVRFAYAPVAGYPLFLAVGVLTLLALAAYPRRARILDTVARARSASGSTT